MISTNIFIKSDDLLSNLLNYIDSAFSILVEVCEKVFFFSLGGIPVIILWLIAGGLFCTFRMGLINILGFKHALEIARGKDELTQVDSDGEESPLAPLHKGGGFGEVSAFQALATALSGSVGLGNIAGVAIAIQMGGAGAVFWMTVSGILGMSIKFVECTLGVKYRCVKPDGTIAGGPMYYLSQGFAEIDRGKIGKLLAILFSLFGIPAALGGGNMFQANQSFAALASVMPFVSDYNWLFGLIVAFLVGLVILGGISRIGIVASKLLPFIVIIYLLACLWVISFKLTEIPHALMVMFTQALSPSAVEGGLAGVLVQGVRRSAFSNGAGTGAAAIAHSVARTNEPIREGIVSILEPFIDTVIICNLTALVILTTGSYGENVAEITSGAALATLAFKTVIDWFPLLLALIMILFAFSTMITWSYYGERCWAYLLGEPSIWVFKGLFLLCIILGSIVNLQAVVDFSDMMLLAMTIPNLIGCLFLSNQVVSDLKIYLGNLARER